MFILDFSTLWLGMFENSKKSRMGWDEMGWMQIAVEEEYGIWVPRSLASKKFQGLRLNFLASASLVL